MSHQSPFNDKGYDENEQYNKDVKRFFEIKQKWEENHPKKCLICNNPNAKMRFEVSHDLYLAKCGKQTCQTIEISRRSFVSFDEKIQQMREKLDNLKRKFIIEKMDTMFKFIDDKNAIKIFKDEFEEYRELLKVYNQHNTETKYREREAKIADLTGKIYSECQEIQRLREGKEGKETVAISDIIDIVDSKLTPLTGELQGLKYPIMEMNIGKMGEIKLYQVSQYPQFIETSL
jgi:predicted RNase H-like nuclease (RuvC/YqgF family)